MEMKNNQVEALSAEMKDFLGPQEKFLFIGRLDSAYIAAGVQRNRLYATIWLGVTGVYTLMVLFGAKSLGDGLGAMLLALIFALFAYFYYRKGEIYKIIASNVVYGLTNMRVFYTDVEQTATDNAFMGGGEKEAKLANFYFKDIHEVSLSEEGHVQIDLNDFTSNSNSGGPRRIVHALQGVEDGAGFVAAMQALLVPFRLPKG